MEFEQYWKAIQQKICPRCLDGDGIGNCRLPVGEECALKSFLPQIVSTVQTIHADSMESYIRALRKNICALCDHRMPNDSCRKRSDLECALDRYYPLVVEIIETVRSEATSS